MSLAQKIKQHAEAKTAHKIGLQKLAWMLGMRQINQLEKDDSTRKELIHYLISKMSDKDIQDQLKIGKEFVCGYRPGIISDGARFDEAASRALFSDKNKSLVKQVLVGGVSLSDLKISASERQNIDQGCITICRMIAPIEAYRRNTAMTLYNKIHGSLNDPTFTYFVMSCLTGVSIKSLKAFTAADSKETPTYSVAAYFLLVSKIMVAEEYREVESALAYIKTSLKDLLVNWHYSTNAHAKKVDKIQAVLQCNVPIHSVILMFEKELRQCPKVIDVFDLQNDIKAFYRLFDKERTLQINNVLVTSFKRIRDVISGGTESLFNISREIGEKAGVDQLSFYNTYNRWLL